MVIEGYSFIKNLLGRNTYNEIKRFSDEYFLIASGVFGVIIIFTLFIHWSFLSSILSLITGTSLIFIAYVVCAIVYFDKQIDVELECDWQGNCKFPQDKPKGYNTTKILGIFLIFLGVLSVYISNRYRKDYAFECETFLVDETKGIYHLDGYNDNCAEIEDETHLVSMRGYEIEKHNYSFCPCCEEWAEDAGVEYQSDRFSRR